MFNGASNWEKYTELVLWWNYMPPWSVEAFCKTHCSLTWIFMKGASSDEYHTKVTEISHVKARRSLSKKAKNCKITYSQKNAVNCWHNDKTAPGVCQLQSRRKHTVGRDNQRASQNRTRNREYNSLLRHNELLPVRQINECRLLSYPAWNYTSITHGQGHVSFSRLTNWLVLLWVRMPNFSEVWGQTDPGRWHTNGNRRA